MTKINVGIVGGTGYTGFELIRLLLAHPHISLKIITSRSDEGILVSDYFPQFKKQTGLNNLTFSHPDTTDFSSCDVVFFATPHGVAMEHAPKLLSAYPNIKIIDLGADFRLKDVETFEKFYGMKHTSTEALARAVYGLPEFNRHELKNARLIAMAGCYPTSVQLGLLPLLKNKWIETSGIIADCKSGITGAGKKADISLLQSESVENVKAYGVVNHRHEPEINQGLSNIAQESVSIYFVPHLMPMVRGIFSTIYTKLKPEYIHLSTEEIQNSFINAYQSEPFIHVLTQKELPQTKEVKGSNFMQIRVVRKSENMIMVLVTEDNLLKGASGQAIQAMNIAFGFDETTALMGVGAV